MSQPSDLMELKESVIAEKILAAQSLLDGFDHTPRLAKAKDIAPAPGRSPGVPGRRRFRSTTPGLVTQSTARAEGVDLIARVDATTPDDALMSPVQAGVLHALRRALAVALALGHHQLAVVLELVEQRPRGFRRRGGHQDAVERPDVAPAEGAVEGLDAGHEGRARDRGRARRRRDRRKSPQHDP